MQDVVGFVDIVGRCQVNRGYGGLVNLPQNVELEALNPALEFEVPPNQILMGDTDRVLVGHD